MSNQQALASAYAEKDEAKKHVETVKTQLKNAKKQKQKEKVKQLSESLILAQKRVARAQMLTRTLKAAQKKQKKMAKKKKEKSAKQSGRRQVSYSFGIKQIIHKEKPTGRKSVPACTPVPLPQANTWTAAPQIQQQIQQQQVPQQQLLQVKPQTQPQPQPQVVTSSVLAPVPEESTGDLDLSVKIVSNTTNSESKKDEEKGDTESAKPAEASSSTTTKTTTTTAPATTTDVSKAANGNTEKTAKTKSAKTAKTKSAKTVKPAKANGELEVVGVIFTISNGSSYDPLFQRVKQDAPEGEVVHVYNVESGFLPYLEAVLTAAPQAPIEDASALGLDIAAIVAAASLPAMKPATEKVLRQAVTEVLELEPDAVVVNFECCSNCSDSGFSLPCRCDAVDPSISFIAVSITRGFLVMVSDFSLKALIHSWTGNHPTLGKNPFVRVGTFNSRFSLAFDTKTLQDCCSEQLKALADISKEGTANVKAMANTIVFSVDKLAAQSSGYVMDILTVMTSFGGRTTSHIPRHQLVTDKSGKSGAAGHVSLTYPSGGVLLASAGHWIELQKVHTDEKSFFNAVYNDYGVASERSAQLRVEYDAVPQARKSAWIQANAQRHVQSRSCAKYSKKKSKWGR